MVHFWVDTDIGGDIDDVLTLLMIPSFLDKHKLIGISTCHINPDEKARIAMWLLNQMNVDVPVYSGEGVFPTIDNRELFFKENPFWPKSFGVPGADLSKRERPMYEFQGKAYREIDSTFDQIKITAGAVDKMVSEASRIFSESGEKMHIVSISPPINIATAIARSPDFAKHIKITMMGGWFDKDQIPTRLGYNRGLNPGHTQAIINSGCENDVVLS
jgi:inosine-uridine nucleoside N-ribohydrolase